MGLADFYLTIHFKENALGDLEKLYKALSDEEVFRILDNEHNNYILSIECKFDNLLPSLIIAYKSLSLFVKSIVSIESHGITRKFDFFNMDEFIMFILSSNENQLFAYYSQLGYFAISSDKYYKKRIRLKKYYKKLKY